MYCRTKKMGRRTLSYGPAPRVYLECVMDNDMYKLVMDGPFVAGFADNNIELV